MPIPKNTIVVSLLQTYTIVSISNFRSRVSDEAIYSSYCLVIEVLVIYSRRSISIFHATTQLNFSLVLELYVKHATMYSDTA